MSCHPFHSSHPVSRLPYPGLSAIVASIRINGYSAGHVTAAPILDHMAALADPIRCRMLLPLERHELTVNEICSVLQLPQSTVSRHLKTLADDGWVTSRRDGTSRFYGMVHAGSRSRRAAALAAHPRADRRHQWRRAGRAPAEERPREAPIEVRRVFCVGIGPVGSPARRVVRRSLPSARACCR